VGLGSLDARGDRDGAVGVEVGATAMDDGDADGMTPAVPGSV
jgi:hypothetical protein